MDGSLGNRWSKFLQKETLVVNKLVKIGLLMFVVLLIATPAFAQADGQTPTDTHHGGFSIYLGGAFARAW